MPHERDAMMQRHACAGERYHFAPFTRYSRMRHAASRPAIAERMRCLSQVPRRAIAISDADKPLSPACQISRCSAATSSMRRQTPYYATVREYFEVYAGAGYFRHGRDGERAFATRIFTIDSFANTAHMKGTILPAIPAPPAPPPPMSLSNTTPRRRSTSQRHEADIRRADFKRAISLHLRAMRCYYHTVIISSFTPEPARRRARRQRSAFLTLAT